MERKGLRFYFFIMLALGVAMVILSFNRTKPVSISREEESLSLSREENERSYQAQMANKKWAVNSVSPSKSLIGEFQLKFSTIEGGWFVVYPDNIEVILDERLLGTFITVREVRVMLYDYARIAESATLYVSTKENLDKWNRYIQNQIKLRDKTNSAREVGPPQ